MVSRFDCAGFLDSFFLASMHVVVLIIVAVLSTCTHKYDIYLEINFDEIV
jgi:hypothetical protein